MPSTPQSESVADRKTEWVDVREIGRVTSVREFIVKVDGLPSCRNGQMVEFGRGGKGMVMGFSEDSVLVLILGNVSNVRAGDEVQSRGMGFSIPVGEEYIGRIVTALGDPIDGGGPIRAAETRPIFREPPGVMERIPVKEALETGVRIVDAGFPIAKGQRQLIIGDQMTGKTTIITDTILNQKDKRVLCIYCGVGQSQSSFMRVLRLLRQKGAMDYTIVVGGIASAPLGEQYIAPYAACALGEYFVSKGYDVFVAFDDLSKHAWAYRQLSLLLERPPGREAYPGDIFYIHSQLLERAGKFVAALGGGTMTFFPVVATIQGDITGYIQTNIISITDGQLYLSTALFQKGFKPSIDFGLSVSRIGSKAQCPAMKEVTGKLRLEYLQYQELLRMTSLKADLSQDAQSKLQRGQVIAELLSQSKSTPSSLVEQVILFYAIRTGILDGLPAARAKFKKDIYRWMKANRGEVLEELAQKKTLTPELKQALDGGMAEFLKAEGLKA